MNTTTEIKRITSSDVLAAYAKTGIKPTRSAWYNTYKDSTGKTHEYACALGACAIAAGAEKKETVDGTGLNEASVRETLELNDHYTLGFWRAFDGLYLGFEGLEDIDLLPYLRGYEDGQRAWRAVALEIGEES